MTSVANEAIDVTAQVYTQGLPTGIEQKRTVHAYQSESLELPVLTEEGKLQKELEKDIKKIYSTSLFSFLFITVIRCGLNNRM